ncbi:MAG TPA: flagellar hook-associated protein FlgK [Candidatus Sulfopaludibacter sp.]|jgi:flagellar hook-associated protein 1 FlgK|nr:flagellar hook-associated protein FlgK [Candidatus Sulfopaludibacter sp.]
MSIISAMLTSAEALKAYDKVLSVTQNNVVNASTPGYARQSISLDAQKFDPFSGTVGGVVAGEMQSTRDDYAEQSVWRQTNLLGESTQDVNSLTALQNNFDISGDSGIPSALNSLLQAFSAWGQTPTDTNARQTVIDQAQNVASAFQDAANGLDQATQDNNQQLQQTLDHVNQSVAQLAQYNSQIMAGDHNDAGLDAQIHSTLEDLSQYVNFTATKQSDGTYTLLLDGQKPLLIENRQYNLSYDLEQPTDPPPTYPDGPPTAHIRAADGSDVTSNVTSGQLGSLLKTRNTVLASYIGDAYHAGDLNTMAKQFADRVNQILTMGSSTDPTVTSGGTALFTYDSTNDTNVARTLAVNSSATTATLAPVDPATQVANGIPLALSALSNPTDSADQINGKSYTEFYADMASRTGYALSGATNSQQVQQSAVAQAQNLRQETSGVNLDEEAMTLVQFQRAYEANSRMITVLDSLTQTVIDILK